MRRRNLGVVLVLLLFVFSACTIQSRRYRKGFYFHQHSKRQKTSPSLSGAQGRMVEDAAICISAGSGPAISGKKAEGDVAVTYKMKQGRYGFAFQNNVRASDVDVSVNAGSSAGSGVAVRGDRKPHWLGLLAFAMSAAGWFAGTFIAFPVFLGAAVLAVISLNQMGRAPERYILKTLSLVALIVAVAGAALSLFTVIVLLFS